MAARSASSVDQYVRPFYEGGMMASWNWVLASALAVSIVDASLATAQPALPDTVRQIAATTAKPMMLVNVSRAENGALLVEYEAPSLSFDILFARRSGRSPAESQRASPRRHRYLESDGASLEQSGRQGRLDLRFKRSSCSSAATTRPTTPRGCGWPIRSLSSW